MNRTTATLIALAASLIVMLGVERAAAFGRRRGNYSASSASFNSVPAGCSNATAQGVAEIMARTGCVGHWGGNRGYEGCGTAATKERAYATCCYADSGMTTIDVGYAQGSNGMWYCCRRYQ